MMLPACTALSAPPSPSPLAGEGRGEGENPRMPRARDQPAPPAKSEHTCRARPIYRWLATGVWWQNGPSHAADAPEHVETPAKRRAELIQSRHSSSQVERRSPPPFNQRLRINAFRILGAVLFPPVLFIKPYFDDGAVGALLGQIGVLLIFGCVLGRCWAILYIGGNKNATVVTEGPYSLCRNPLYAFSIMGVVGFGLLVQSLAYTAVVTLLTFLVLLQGARREEAYLMDKFGDDYVFFKNRTPRFMPTDFRSLHTAPGIRVNVRALKQCLCDAAFFVLAIPAVEVVDWIRESNAIATVTLF